MKTFWTGIIITGMLGWTVMLLRSPQGAPFNTVCVIGMVVSAFTLAGRIHKKDEAR